MKHPAHTSASTLTESSPQPIEAQAVHWPTGQLGLHLGLQRTTSTPGRGDVLYVHGATFGSDLSIFFRFDGASWADSLAAEGWNVWGFDFAGYGRSERYTPSTEPVGDAASAADQLATVVRCIREQNGNRPVALIAHSWGSLPAIRFAAAQPDSVSHLVLFGPIASRNAGLAVPTSGSTRQISIWEQYRRFVEDVPRGQPQVLSDRHMQAWGEAYLRSDPASAAHDPASVNTPNGPLLDLLAMWNGKAYHEAGKITLPTLLIRGEWDSVCNDADAAHLMSTLASRVKRDIKIPRATHLMHLEAGRKDLYHAVNQFLADPAAMKELP